MINGCLEEEVIVHPVGGMQLATGVIRMDESRHFICSLPGMATLVGDSIEDVLQCLDRWAKTYYGDDVVVEIASHAAAG